MNWTAWICSTSPGTRSACEAASVRVCVARPGNNSANLGSGIARRQRAVQTAALPRSTATCAQWTDPDGCCIGQVLEAQGPPDELVLDPLHSQAGPGPPSWPWVLPALRGYCGVCMGMAVRARGRVLSLPRALCFRLSATTTTASQPATTDRPPPLDPRVRNGPHRHRRSAYTLDRPLRCAEPACLPPTTLFDLI